MTRIEWEWDETSGSLFQRFSRSQGAELWLVGREISDNPEAMVGRWIIENGLQREARRICLAFSFHPQDMDRAKELAESAAIDFPKMPRAEIIEALMILSIAPKSMSAIAWTDGTT